MVQALVRIEDASTAVVDLSLTVSVLASLRETARLFTTHYSTMIEGNQLDSEQVAQVIQLQGHFPGKERDEREVLGYYAALEAVERWAAQKKVLSTEIIQEVHALVMANGAINIRPTAYRDGQNVIKDARTKRIVYLPPEAHDVPLLMSELIEWVERSSDLSCPIVAAIVHYQFATIHPYFDGNGRTARLLTTFLLHRGGYDLKGIYSLEEYYARDLLAYYRAISAGDSHNYYLGRAEADITHWIEYFLVGMADACQKVVAALRQEKQAVDNPDHAALLRGLDARQRKILQLFTHSSEITSKEIAAFFECSDRTAAAWCQAWVKKDFFVVTDPSNRGRKYGLALRYSILV